MKAMILIGVVLACTACSSENAVSQEKAPNKGVASSHYLKPGAAAEISYRWLQKPSTGSPGRLELTVTSRSPAAKLDIEVNADASLQLMGGGKKANYQWQKSGEGPLVQTLEVTPIQDGLHYLSVIIHSTVGGETRARAFAIPVQVGAVSEKATQHPYLVEQQDGSKIIELPAEER